MFSVYEIAKPALRKPDAAIFRIDLLAPMSATTLDGTSLLPVGAKTKGVLAILALSERRPVARRALSGLLWSRRSDDQARASLRQEIHRLAEALRPLGTDIIDVQRHTLSLRPVLASVDVERYFNAGPGNILKLPETDGMLAPDLNGIDGAFDDWLNEQRGALRRHLTSVLEQAAQTLADPEHREQAARRLLALDELSETGWRTYLRFLASHGEQAAALQAAAECSEIFRNIRGCEPSPAIVDLISRLRSGRRDADSSEIRRGDDTEDGRGADTSGLAPVRSGSFQEEGLPEGRVLRVEIRALRVLSPDPALADMAQIVTDTLTEGMNRDGLFQMIEPADEPDVKIGQSAGPSPEEALSGRRTDADYVFSGVLRVSEAARKFQGVQRIFLLLRLHDVRRDNALIWAERLELSDGTPEKYVDQVICDATWRILIAESRNILPRLVASLSPLQMAFRALGLLLRNETGAREEAEHLLLKALESEPERPFHYLCLALVLLVQIQDSWEVEKRDWLQRACDAARVLAARLPESAAVRLLLSRALLQDPLRRKEGLALLQNAPVTERRNVFALTQSFAALAEGNASACAQMREDVQSMIPAYPLLLMFRAETVLALFLAGRSGEALRAVREGLAIFPAQSGLMVLFLAIAGTMTEGQDEAELEDIRKRLLFRCPELTTEKILARYNYLCPEHIERLRQGLTASGMPETLGAGVLCG
ncbi:hypothetical protein LOC54_02630 [Acetobacter sp. AN02]|uniref:BTAD domain-containing putative transcriptional regulator n=1 Tax=Acetobacter sp. AN02 TaxID=2894186 RepID=UPI0024342D79|nr:BTAD domain-containing putative transcriptional regulator [Acetobacter sp. AN02]MDG6094019.1 hypothetical protein [Acetobacter sp. AN02]